MERRAKWKILSKFPDTGELRRELYPKHLEFFRAGAKHRERCFLAANRVGKTVAGAYEMTCHATGIYPHWWEGRRIDRPQLYWAAGDTGKTTRDVIQTELIGPQGAIGTEMIPAELILDTVAKPGVPGAVEFVYVKHASGGRSTICLKSFDQRRESFQGTKPICIWLDEECPQDIYVECLTRTMTNNGFLMLTFTPLTGKTDIVRSFEEVSQG
jgi:phage terminase large subunit-like protein